MFSPFLIPSIHLSTKVLQNVMFTKDCNFEFMLYNFFVQLCVDSHYIILASPSPAFFRFTSTFWEEIMKWICSSHYRKEWERSNILRVQWVGLNTLRLVIQEYNIRTVPIDIYLRTFIQKVYYCIQYWT